ncbi:MAG: M1 family aminopeptidase [Planctomycetota bacterium]
MHSATRQSLLRSAPLLSATLLVAGCYAAIGPQPAGPPRRIESKPTASPLARGFDVESYTIDLEVDPVTRRVEGTCAVRFGVDAELLEQLTFDLAGLELYGALGADGRRLAARQAGSTVTIDLPEALLAGDEAVVHMRYGGVPTVGLKFLGRRADGTPTAIYTSGGPESARGWFPCTDHPLERATTQLALTVPAAWQVVASGERVEARNDGARQVEVWRLAVPHAAHRFGLAAGDLSSSGSGDSLPDGSVSTGRVHVQRLAPAELLPDLEASLAVTAEALPVLERLFGVKYPYPALSQAVLEGLPENTLTFASLVLHDARLVGDAHAREDESPELAIVRGLAAQWAGGCIEAASWADAWVMEGLADYAALLWCQEARGADAFARAVRERQNTAVASGAALPLSADHGFEIADRFAGAFRERACVRMHLVRSIVGERAFRGSIRTLFNERANTPKSTNDFFETLERVGGADLDEFRADWIDAAGHPAFVLDWRPVRGEDAVTVDVRQMQSSAGAWPALFRGDCVIEVRDERGVSLHAVRIDSRRSSFDLLTSGGKPLAVRFDLHESWPKSVEREWDGPESLTLARRSEDAAGRHDACVALGRIAARAERARVSGSSVYVAELVDRLERDSSPWVRAAAARSLGAVSAVEAKERLLRAIENDPAAGVRVAALRALTPERVRVDAELAAFGRRVFDSNATWATRGAAACLVAATDPEALVWLEAKLREPSNGDRLSLGVLDALGALDSPRIRFLFADLLADPARSVAVRGHAARLLADERFDRDSNARAIATLLESDVPRLRRDAVEALATMGIGTARQALETYYPASGSATERRAIEASLGTRRPLSGSEPRTRYDDAR